MKILFLKGSAPLSKLILAETKESVSHCALQFGNFIVHANLLGVHVEWAPNVFKKDQIIYSLVHAGSGIDYMMQDKDRLTKLLEADEWAWYDFGALLYLGLYLFCKNYLKFSFLPKKNLWHISGAFLCTEWVEEFTSNTEDPMITPEGLYNYLKSTNKWVDGGNQNETKET